MNYYENIVNEESIGTYLRLWMFLFYINLVRVGMLSLFKKVGMTYNLGQREY